jgi:hypothetical protein
MKGLRFGSGRGECLALFGRWERGELTDQQLLAVMRTMRARQGRFQECLIGRELDSELKERVSRR